MKKQTLKKNPILNQSEVRPGWSISLWRDGNLQSLHFRWQSSAGHSSCYVCGFSTWNWGIFIQKRFLTWTKGHCIWVFVLKRAAWANAACKLHGFTADWLQHSQLCVLTHSASACAGFSHPIFAHNIIYRHLGRKTQLMKSACAEGSLSLCWDSEISDLRIEILGRMTASFLTLVAEVSVPLWQTHDLQSCQ